MHTMPTINDAYISRRAITDYARLCASKGYLFREPSEVERDGDMIILSHDQGVLARFRIHLSGRLQHVQD